MPELMRGLAIAERPPVGGLSDHLRMMELPLPTPGAGEVRVRIQASAINVDDQHLAEGTMFGGFPIAPRPTPARPWVPGTDFAGVVDAVGGAATQLEVGQPVFGLRGPRTPGPWAERCIASATSVSPIPVGWSAPEAASLCLSGMVVCSILDALGPPAGSHVLVLGASGSIGTTLVPALARAGTRVWGVCSARNRALVLGLGAERALDYGAGPFRAQLGDTRLDAVIDLVGGLDNEVDGRAVIREGGAFITIVGPEAHVGERKLGMWGLMKMIGHILAVSVMSRLRGPRYTLVGPVKPDFDAIRRRITDAGIRPTVDHVVPFEEAAVREALRYVASHRARGKVVIALP